MTYIYTAQGKLYTNNSKSCKNINSSISQNYKDTKNITCNTCYNNQRINDKFTNIVHVPSHEKTENYTDINDMEILK